MAERTSSRRAKASLYKPAPAPAAATSQSRRGAASIEQGAPQGSSGGAPGASSSAVGSNLSYTGRDTLQPHASTNVRGGVATSVDADAIKVDSVGGRAALPHVQQGTVMAPRTKLHNHLGRTGDVLVRDGHMRAGGGGDDGLHPYHSDNADGRDGDVHMPRSSPPQPSPLEPRSVATARANTTDDGRSTARIERAFERFATTTAAKDFDLLSLTDTNETQSHASSDRAASRCRCLP